MTRPMAPAIRLVANGFLTQLCAYHLGTELLQLQGQGTDTDGGSQLLSLLVGLPYR